MGFSHACMWKLDRIISKLRPWLLVECKLPSTGSIPDIDVGTARPQKQLKLSDFCCPHRQGQLFLNDDFADA